jgi:ABC-2 type transport system permease protein
MPVIFILMFAYLFGGAILLPGGGNYHEYLIGGMLGMGLAQTRPASRWRWSPTCPPD